MSRWARNCLGKSHDCLSTLMMRSKRDNPAELDQRSFKAHLAEAQANISLAEANLEVAKARLERARIDARDSEAQRAVLNARTDNAKVKAEAANIELRRKELLQQHRRGQLATKEGPCWTSP